MDFEFLSIDMMVVYFQSTIMLRCSHRSFSNDLW